MPSLLSSAVFLALWLSFWANPALAQDTCYNVRINHKGSNGAAITVDSTTGGVVIVDANTSRCTLTIINETANPMRCAPSTGPYALTVSTTVGAYIPPGTYPVFGKSSREQWKCIRTTGTSATVSILEDLP